MTAITLFVHMKPVTQGSVSAFPVKRKNGTYGAVVTHAHKNELYSLRSTIEDEYRQAGGTLTDGAVHVKVRFLFIRPKSASPKKRPDMTVRPDVDKLCRTVLDALTGVAYKDDSQVVGITAIKEYGEEEGIEILIGGVDRE
ncbi:MAG: RusA family crossover junction endodeoxyribonuclease [Gudongella sp.]|jgi:Holliday junction resolvase RusA-like endonuclease|nr:RusA family crossover junction endodeoxyribonuclease [Gudongella sp.]